MKHVFVEIHSDVLNIAELTCGALMSLELFGGVLKLLTRFDHAWGCVPAGKSLSPLFGLLNMAEAMLLTRLDHASECVPAGKSLSPLFGLLNMAEAMLLAQLDHASGMFPLAPPLDFE